MSTPVTIAVDWSGAQTGAPRRIAVAEAADGQLVDLRDGLTREEVVAHLLDRIAALDAPVVVGLDFAFGFPGWWTRELGCADLPELWALAAREGERWLTACEAPLWGRPGRRRPPADLARPLLRATDAQAATAGSPLQVGGAGSVGTGSIRGMPHLVTLRAAGVAIWPVDDARSPVAVEVYPRHHTGRVVKSDRAARAAAVATTPGIGRALREAAAITEDRFDAALTALGMQAHAADLLGRRADPAQALEGAIWPSSGELSALSAAR